MTGDEVVSSPKQTLWLVEPLFSGHHGVYVKWMIKGAMERGYQVLLATGSDNANHPLFPLLKDEFKANLRIEFLPFKPPLDMNSPVLFALMAQENHFYNLFAEFYKRTCKTCPPSFVLLPYLDYCRNALALRGAPFGKTPWGGITMRVAFHLNAMRVHAPRKWPDCFKRRLFFRLLKNSTLTALFTIDPLLEQFVKSKRPDLSKRCQYLPDPAEMQGSVSQQAARRVLGIVDSAVVLLVYGIMNARKGLDGLLNAMQEHEFPDHVHVILAGRQDAETETFLALPRMQHMMNAGRLHVINEFLNQDKESTVFAAADLIWMGYCGHYVMSGVMVQAGQMGLPIIGCDDGVIGWLTKKKELGITVNNHDPKTVAIAIHQFTINKDHMRRCGENGRSIFASHTPAMFVQLLYDSMMNKTGEAR